MRKSAFGTTKNRVLVGETYSTNNDSTVLASMMAQYKQKGMVGYSDNAGTVKAPRFEGDLIGNANTSTRANTVSYTVAVNDTPNITGFPQYLNSDLYLTSTSALILTIISPNETGVSGLQYKIYNTSSFTITLNINTGIFTGKYGSGESTLIVPANTWVQLNSDGENWLGVDRSVENQVYNLSTSDATFTSGTSTNYQYAGSTLFLTSTYDVKGTFSFDTTTSAVFQYPFSTFTIPSATDVNVFNQTYTIYNNSLVNNIRLSSASTFIGQYQNTASPITTSDIGVNSSLIFYSNGTNWVVTSGSSTLSNLQIQTGSFPMTITRANLRRTNIVSVANNSNIPVIFPTPIASDIGLEYFLTHYWGASTASTVAYYFGSLPASGLLANPIVNGAAGGVVLTGTSTNLGSTSQATGRIVARQTGFSGGGSVSFTSAGVMTIITHTSGFIFYNSIIKFSGGTATVTASSSNIASTGIYSNGGNPPTTGIVPTYNVVLTGGAYPAFNTTVSATWNDTITWVGG